MSPTSKNILSRLGSRWITVLLSLALMAVVFIHPFTREMGELWLYDLRLQHIRNPEASGDIVFIAIDQPSLDRYGAFPWKRNLYGELLKELSDAKPRIVIFDVLFQEKKPEDAEFADAIEKAGFPVVLAENFFVENALGESRRVPVVDVIEKKAAATGFIDLTLVDPDGKVRWAQLARSEGDETYFSLDLTAFALIKGETVKSIQLGKDKVSVGGSEIPVNSRNGVLINYFFGRASGGTFQTFPVLSFQKVMERPEVRDALKDKIIIIGAGTRGMQDDFPTPLGPKTYGGVIHANILNTLLNGSYINRAPGWMNLLIVLAMPFIFGFGVSRFAKVLNVALFSFGLILLYFIANFMFFRNGYWLDLSSPVIAVFTCFAVVLGVQFFRTHRLFQQFVAPEIVDQMVSDEEFAKLGGKEVEVSILFSDIRGYTSLSEKMTPSQVMEMLNEYHTEMVHIFEKNHGRVFDYMGDAQMVVYGAPKKLDNHALWACRAALETQDALTRLCEKWNVENKTAFEVGVGICTGTVAIGLVGAEGHKQYTAIGDSTNVASRLQGQSKVLGAPIIISPYTAKMVDDYFELKSLGKVELKGKSESVEVFTLAGEKGFSPQKEN